LVLTGRRRTEVINMKVKDLNLDGDRAYYTYRGKGGKTGRRELPQPALDALRLALKAFGLDLATMPPDASLWPSRSPNGKGLTSGTFYGNLQKYFKLAGIPPAGVHIFRHTAAKLRRDAGETIEDVSRFLDHSSLAVTTVYLRRLEGEQDKSWNKVAEAIGI
jgi:integrase